MRRILALVLCVLALPAFAQTVVRITAVPTAGGVVHTAFRDGNDGAGSGPTTPEMSQPSVISSSSTSIPLLTACTGGTAPLSYEIEKSSTSSVAGWAVHATGITFTDGIYVMTGLTASTTYWTRLSCVDNVARRSAYSGVFTFTTPAAGGGDVTAPTAPTNVSATSSTAGQAVSTWTNGTDAVGIVTTNIIRGTVTNGLTCSAFSTGTVIDSIAYPATSYTDLSAPSGTTVYYRQEHLDAAGNISTKSSRLCVTVASPSSGGVKFNPGHYVKVQGSACQADQAAYESEVFNGSSNLPRALESPFIGANVQVCWGAMNPTGSTFDWDFIDDLLAWAATNNKHLVLMIHYKINNTGANVITPTDLNSQKINNNLGQLPAVWCQTVMDRYIAAQQALAARHDDHANLEIVLVPESAPSNPVASDYSPSGLSAQYQRLYAAMGVAYEETIASASINSLNGEIAILMEAAYQDGISFATPDAHDSCAGQMFRNVTVTCAGSLEDPIRDYRALQAYHTIVSSPVNGGKDDNGPPPTTINWAQTNKVTHLSWTAKSTSPYTWAEIKSDINADPLLHTACPTIYTCAP